MLAVYAASEDILPSNARVLSLPDPGDTLKNPEATHLPAHLAITHSLPDLTKTRDSTHPIKIPPDHVVGIVTTASTRFHTE